MLTLVLVLVIAGLAMLNLLVLSSRKVVVYQFTPPPAETPAQSGCLLWLVLFLGGMGLLAWLLASQQ